MNIRGRRNLLPSSPEICLGRDSANAALDLVKEADQLRLAAGGRFFKDALKMNTHRRSDTERSSATACKPAPRMIPRATVDSAPVNP
jgi:hypothetical protein